MTLNTSRKPKHDASAMQMSIPQVKSMYESSAHIDQPCANGTVRASLYTKVKLLTCVASCSA